MNASIIDRILHWDVFLFLKINQINSSPLLDSILVPIRNPYFWAPFYLFLSVFLLFNYKKQGLGVVVLVLFCFLCTDQLSSHVIKPAIARLRPCNDPALEDYVRLLVRCGRAYSFISAHATNHFAIATVLSIFFKSMSKWIPLSLFFWATMVAYAQVYVGVHYPMDVLAGGLIGCLVGTLIGFIGLQRLKPLAPLAD